jgi:hypothetical protein
MFHNIYILYYINNISGIKQKVINVKQAIKDVFDALNKKAHGLINRKEYMEYVQAHKLQDIAW